MLNYGPFYRFFNSIKIDATVAGNILIASSLFAVIACFGNFEFKYEQINLKNKVERIAAHATTALLMLIIGISLIITQIMIDSLIGHFLLFTCTLILVYVSCVAYDFMDLLRAVR